MKEFKLTKKMLEFMGTGSLTGYLMKAGIIPTNEPIKLLFQQSSFEYKRTHNGSDIIIPEFSPMCMAESLINLIEKGYKIIIGEYTDDSTG